MFAPRKLLHVLFIYCLFVMVCHKNNIAVKTICKPGASLSNLEVHLCKSVNVRWSAQSWRLIRINYLIYIFTDLWPVLLPSFNIFIATPTPVNMVNKGFSKLISDFQHRPPLCLSCYACVVVMYKCEAQSGEQYRCVCKDRCVTV